jgi:hypothetical protein
MFPEAAQKVQIAILLKRTSKFLCKQITTKNPNVKVSCSSLRETSKDAYRQGKKLDHWITICKPSLDCLDGILCLPDSLQNP